MRDVDKGGAGHVEPVVVGVHPVSVDGDHAARDEPFAVESVNVVKGTVAGETEIAG